MKFKEADVVEQIEIRLPVGSKDTLDPEFREETLRLYHLFDADGSGKLEAWELENVQNRLRISRGKSFGQHDVEFNRRHVYIMYFGFLKRDELILLVCFP